MGRQFFKNCRSVSFFASKTIINCVRDVESSPDLYDSLKLATT